MKKAFLVQCLGYWGRGKTLKEAAQNCLRAGAKRPDFVIVDLVLGDDTPEVSQGGMNLLLAEGAQIIRIGTNFELKHLLWLDDDPS